MSLVLFLMLIFVAVALVLAPIFAGIAIFQIKKTGDAQKQEPSS